MKQVDTGFAAHASTEKHIEVISLDSFIPSSIEPGASAADMQRSSALSYLQAKKIAAHFARPLTPQKSAMP